MRVGWIALVALMSAAAHGDTVVVNAPFVGHPLKTHRLVCSGDKLVSTGYYGGRWETEKTFTVAATTEPVAITSIVVRGDLATVSQVGKMVLDNGSAKTFRFENTANAAGGWRLIERDRAFGWSTRMITIDPTDGSFIDVTQHVDALIGNRANIFYGACHDAK